MICSISSVSCIGPYEKKVKLLSGQNPPSTKSTKIQNLICMNVYGNSVVAMIVFWRILSREDFVLYLCTLMVSLMIYGILEYFFPGRILSSAFSLHYYLYSFVAMIEFWRILSWEDFVPGGFCPRRILSQENFVPGRFCPGRILSSTYAL